MTCAMGTTMSDHVRASNYPPRRRRETQESLGEDARSSGRSVWMTECGYRMWERGKCPITVGAKVSLARPSGAVCEDGHPRPRRYQNDRQTDCEVLRLGDNTRLLGLPERGGRKEPAPSSSQAAVSV